MLSLILAMSFPKEIEVFFSRILFRTLAFELGRPMVNQLAPIVKLTS
jgi:hypothetical protein